MSTSHLGRVVLGCGCSHQGVITDFRVVLLVCGKDEHELCCVKAVRGDFTDGSKRSEIVAWIGQQTGEWGLDQVKAKFVGVPNGTISSLIHKLVKMGWIERLRFAWYENTDLFGVNSKAPKPNKIEDAYRNMRAENGVANGDSE